MTQRPRRTRSRALVGIGLVVLLGAGLGAYFGIRGVEGAGSAPSGGQPAARTDAAMAYDAADGTVVLFGGQGRSRSLSDTWTWNGSAWSEAHPKTSPPALSGAQMTYDPVSHDVLLVGGQHLTGSPLGGVACASSGSSGSGSSSSVSGSTGWIPPAGAQPADAPAPGGNVSVPLIATGCGFSDSANTATWLWNGSDWTKAAGTTPPIGFGEWSLATDPVSGKAVLLAGDTLVAQPDSPIAEPAIACPMQANDTNGATGTPCPVFPIQRPNQSWVWTGHAWQVIKSTPSTTAVGFFGSRVIADAVTGHLAMFGNAFLPVTASPCPTCRTSVPIANDAPQCCTGSISVWTGTTWKQTKPYTSGPMLSNAIFVGDPSTHSDLALTTNGQTWSWTGVWTRLHPGTTPTSLDGSAFAYDSTTGQVVVFGGIGLNGRANGLYDQTWTWDGSDWSLRGGSTAPAVTIPVPSPVSVPPVLPCPTLPASPSKVPQPQYACAGPAPGSSGGGSGSASGASGSASSTGVFAP
ncbi:MAG TPA: kelch repeat-containing protein [Candidatus Dormibacteraeota bacterium]